MSILQTGSHIYIIVCVCGKCGGKKKYTHMTMTTTTAIALVVVVVVVVLVNRCK